MNFEVLRFWKPEEQIERYNRAQRMANEKHFYQYSNQFIIDSTIIDARP